MNLRRSTWLACLALTAIVLPASARAEIGAYLGIQGGVGLPTKTNIQATSGGVTDSGDTRFKDGPLGGIVLGYGFASGLQPEVEVTYQRNKVKGGGGDLRAGAVIGSLYYNFVQNGYYFYLGGGGGYSRLHLNLDDIGGDSDNRAVYQGGTGVGVVVTSHLLIGLDYRYRGTFERARFSYDVAGTPAQTRLHFDGSLFSFGLRWSFGGGAPTRRAPGAREPVRVVPLEPN